MRHQRRERRSRREENRGRRGLPSAEDGPISAGAMTDDLADREDRIMEDLVLDAPGIAPVPGDGASVPIRRAGTRGGKDARQSAVGD